MYKEEYELLDNANKMGKHGRQLQRCRYYINVIASGNVSTDILVEAEKFAFDTHDDLLKDDVGIVMANRCREPRNVNPISNLVLNLEALEKMLKELIGKEGNGIKENWEKLNDTCAKNLDVSF